VSSGGRRRTYSSLCEFGDDGLLQLEALCGWKGTKVRTEARGRRMRAEWARREEGRETSSSPKHALELYHFGESFGSPSSAS